MQPATAPIIEALEEAQATAAALLASSGGDVKDVVRRYAKHRRCSTCEALTIQTECEYCRFLRIRAEQGGEL